MMMVVVVITIVVIHMDDAATRQEFTRVLLKAAHAAGGTEIVGLTLIFGFPLGGFGVNFHFADGVDCDHYCLLRLHNG